MSERGRTPEAEAGRQRCAELLDAWAVEHQKAAEELKTLALQLVRDEGIIGWRVLGQELARMEV